jgi:hypothetical protein
MSPDPISVLREAIRAVPAVKWALGVGGVLAAVALVYLFKLDARVAFVGVVVLFCFMGVLVIFARASTLRSGAIFWPAMVFTWFVLIMFIVSTVSLFTSVFFRAPLDLQQWLTGRAAVAAVPIPGIPDADSGWIDGGSSPNMFCDPILANYQKKYPEFNVTMTLLPEQHRSEYNPFKHDLYRYQCSFVASQKK